MHVELSHARGAAVKSMIIQANMYLAVYDDAVRFHLKTGPDHNVPDSLRQRRRCVAVSSSDGANTGLLDPSLRFGCGVGGFVRASSTCCQQTILVPFACSRLSTAA